MKYHFLFFNTFSNVMILNINVFWSVFLSWIRSQEYCTLIVSAKCYIWNIKIQFLEQWFNPNYLPCCITKTHVFCFCADKAYVTKYNLDTCLIVIGHILDTDELYNICQPHMYMKHGLWESLLRMSHTTAHCAIAAQCCTIAVHQSTIHTICRIVIPWTYWSMHTL